MREPSVLQLLQVLRDHDLERAFERAAESGTTAQEKAEYAHASRQAKLHVTHPCTQYKPVKA